MGRQEIDIDLKEMSVIPERSESSVDPNLSHEQILTDSHQRLNSLAVEHGFSSKDLDRIAAAENILRTVMDGKVRKDGKPYAWHSYEVALIILDEMHGTPSAVVKALLHDTIEDSGGVITKDVLENQFGKRIADSVKALSEARSSTLRTLRLRTKYQLVERIARDPEDIAVKLADRLHFFRTIRDPRTGTLLFSDQSLREKARETMEIYVPLAVALGFHEAEQELAGNAIIQVARTTGIDDISFRYPQEVYQSHIEPFRVFVDRLREAGWVGNTAKARIPRIDDAYKAVDGNVTMVHAGDVPNVVALPVSGFGPDRKNGDGPDPWTGSVAAIASEMMRLDLILPVTYERIMEQIAEGRRSVRVTDRKGMIPTRFLFVRPEDDRLRYATVFDVHNRRDHHLAKIARAKITSLRTTFRTVLSTSMMLTIEDLSFSLKAGGTIAVDVERRQSGRRRVRRHGVAIDSNLIDLLFSSRPVDHAVSVVGASVNRDRLSVWSLDHPLEPDLRVRFLTGDRSKFGPEWLDIARMPSTKRKIRRALEVRLAEEAEQGLNDAPESMTQRVLTRGYRIVNSQFHDLSRDHGLPVRDLQLPLTRAEHLYEQKDIRYPQKDSRYGRYYDFLLSVGLDVPGHVPTQGRTSVVDRVALYMFGEEHGLETIRCSVPHKKGQLVRITEVLAQRGVNIISVRTSRNPISPDDAIVDILVTSEDLKLLSEADLTLISAAVIRRDEGD
jgi:hypothetical protein